MDAQLVQGFISTIGFPIFVAVWMLYKSSKDSEKMSEGIQELKNAIIEITTLIKSEKKDDANDK